MADPTTNSLAKFDDPSLWVIVPHVPIFVPHERQRESDGQTLYVVDTNTLQEIANETLLLEVEAGVLPKLQIGHTEDDAPETEQPPLVGFVRHLRVDTWGPAEKIGLVADLYYRKEEWERANKYPFRSPEYYPSRKTITAVALLERDPELDMGMLLFSRQDEWQALGEHMPEPGIKKAEPNQDFREMPGTEKTETHHEQDSLPDAEMHRHMLEHYKRHFHAHYMRHGGLPHPQHHAEHYATTEHAQFHPLHQTAVDPGEAMPDKVNHNAGAGPGMASSTDAMIPGVGPAHKASVQHFSRENDEQQRMQREEQAIAYRRQEERIAALEEQLKTEKYARRRAFVEQQVTQLQAEGYQIKNRPTLVEKLAKLDESECDERLKDIRENYQRIPLDRPMIRLHEGAQQAGPSREQHDEAVSLASRKGDYYGDYDKALAHVRNGSRN